MIGHPGLILNIWRQHGEQQRKLGTIPLAYRLVQRLSELQLIDQKVFAQSL